MKVPIRFSALLLLTLLPGWIWADCASSVYIGPEFYHMVRIRQGGLKQRGWIFGGRAGYDRIKPFSWYLGADYLYAAGTIEGHSGGGADLKSQITDSIVEARVGLTFCPPQGRPGFFTPFAGYGHFCETNDFESPSPVPFKFTDTYHYIVGGFLSGVYFTPLLSMGINFKVRFMLDGSSRVTDDPLFENQTLLMNNETSYRLEIPLAYQFCGLCSRFRASCIPFYEYRHFGGREDFPFDFIDTKFNLFGALITVAYQF